MRGEVVRGRREGRNWEEKKELVEKARKEVRRQEVCKGSEQ